MKKNMNNMALYFECRVNKNADSDCFFGLLIELLATIKPVKTNWMNNRVKAASLGQLYFDNAHILHSTVISAISDHNYSIIVDVSCSFCYVHVFIYF